jgi:hypothetical protein
MLPVHKLLPDPDDIVVHASVQVDETVDLDNLSGHKLHDVWQQLVCATHIDVGEPRLAINKQLFMPPDLTNFLAVRCRAVSAGEKWGPNSNGDFFPRSELIKSHHTLQGKGFYVEHSSHDPRNAVGVVVHSQYVDNEDYVVAVALVDKVRFPDIANMIRTGLTKRGAGVSIGCIAGEAECSECGNIAKKRYEICRCMDRSSPFCKKGRRMPKGHIAHDLCRFIAFYELSHTKAPADRDALPYVVLGAKADENEGKPAPTGILTAPTEAELMDIVQKEAESLKKSFIHKLVKGQLDRVMVDDFRNLQVEIKPTIRQLVRQLQPTK